MALIDFNPTEIETGISSKSLDDCFIEMSFKIGKFKIIACKMPLVVYLTMADKIKQTIPNYDEQIKKINLDISEETTKQF